jgi:phage/plasmid primase-like uncharacterized protein
MDITQTPDLNKDILNQDNTLQALIAQYMTSKDLPCHEEIIFDGVIHRYSSRGTQDKDEWYIAHEIAEGLYICVFASWRHEDHFVWRSYEEHELPDEKIKIESINNKILKEKQTIEKEQIKNAEAIYKNAEICLKHPYLSLKHIQPHNVRAKGNTLYIPMYNIENKLTSLQSIFIDNHGKFQKRFKGGISTKNLFHVLGNIDACKKYIICEGFATGASIYENTDIPVVIAFSATNCLLVGKSFQYLYPDKTPYLAVDNDDKGLETLGKWQECINEFYFLPTKKDYDFNDLYNELPKNEVDKIFKPNFAKSILIKEMLNKSILKKKWFNSIIAEGSFNIIYGTGGIGKSRIAYEMAYCLTINEQFLYFKPDGNYNILYIDGELQESEIQLRLKDIHNRYGNMSFVEERFSLFTMENALNHFNTELNLFNPEHRECLEKMIETSDIIFLDNFGSLTIPPDGDSFKLDKVVWIKLFNWIKKWETKGKSFVMVMHSNKSGNLEGIGKIRNDADLVIQLKKPIDLDTNSLCHFEVHFEKTRTIPIAEAKPFYAKRISSRTMFHGWNNCSI